jgi:hypothetical protein
MNAKIKEDLTEMKKKLKEYVDIGRTIDYHNLKEEPMIAGKPDSSKIKPLRKMDSCNMHFLAVDCSTRTLKRANYWGVYLLRVAFALVKGRDVDWGYEERICTKTGDSHKRAISLRYERLELESEMALNMLNALDIRDLGRSKRTDYALDAGDYLLLDGASFFGKKRGFSVSLYETCKKNEINLLTVSKQSSTLRDEKGHDFMASVYMLSSYPLWVYYPAGKANTDEHLYGDASVVKLCQESPRFFRCDIMEYLTDREVDKLISPLTFTSEDPRCLGYPVPLWLAHDFSTPSDSMLFHYYTQIEETLANAGLLDCLRMEELSCNFPDELHGVRRPFEWERIERV